MEPNQPKQSDTKETVLVVEQANPFPASARPTGLGRLLFSSILTISKTTILTIALIMALDVNVATITIGPVFNSLSAAVEAVADLVTNRPFTVRSRQNAQLSKMQKRHVAEINSLKGKHQVQRARLTEQLNAQKAGVKAKKVKVRSIADRITRRSVRNASLNVASMPAEAVPWVGCGVVAAVTAVDIKDACDSMADMNEIMRELEVEGYSDEQDEICGHKVNFREQYAAFEQDLGGFIAKMKKESAESLREIWRAVGGTTREGVERVRRTTDDIYTAIGGTMAQIFGSD